MRTFLEARGGVRRFTGLTPDWRVALCSGVSGSQTCVSRKLPAESSRRRLQGQHEGASRRGRTHLFHLHSYPIRILSHGPMFTLRIPVVVLLVC